MLSDRLVDTKLSLLLIEVVVRAFLGKPAEPGRNKSTETGDRGSQQTIELLTANNKHFEAIKARLNEALSYSPRSFKPTH